ncbi:MAG TPA: YjgN family protein [Albitalea sp.]|jgi:uncharacterized membrane protein YjgN (DUF898 family)|nr:YjgN family protein [Albitalea sp.]
MSQPSWNGAAAPAFEDTTPATPAAEPGEHRLDIRFTGSGSEYFRIWIVNLLLIIVTLTLYYPWAKVRRLRYFYGNTLVGGQPLDFHGSPTKMLRGYLLVGALGVLYSVAGNFSPAAGLVAFLIVAAIWPALLKSSMQFRLANTSWRGLRFRFNGSLGGAYRAMLPLFVPGLCIVVALLGVENRQAPPAWYGALFLIVMLLTLALGPWLWWSLKKYQHDHYALGQWQTELRAGKGSFYGVFAKTFGVFVLAIAATSMLIGILVAIGGVGGLLAGGKDNVMVGVIIGFAIGGVAMLAAQIVPRPYFTSRLQNLLWSRTANPTMQFASELRFRPLLGLTLKNWLLMVVTLGLYWPFAAVAMQRMRIEAVSVTTQTDPDSLVDQCRSEQGDAAGDAAGDLFGLDIGL